MQLWLICTPLLRCGPRPADGGGLHPLPPCAGRGSPPRAPGTPDSTPIPYHDGVWGRSPLPARAEFQVCRKVGCAASPCLGPQQSSPIQPHQHRVPYYAPFSSRALSPLPGTTRAPIPLHPTPNGSMPRPRGARDWTPEPRGAGPGRQRKARLAAEAWAALDFRCGSPSQTTWGVPQRRPHQVVSNVVV